MGINYFAYITGIASLLGFILQIFDVFPKHAEFRKSAFLFIFGVFIGSFIKALDASQIKVDFSLSGYSVLVGVFILVIVGFLIAAAYMSDSSRRKELFGVSGIGFFVLMIILFAGTLMNRSCTSPEIEKSRLTINELILLVDSAEQRKDFDRAIMHLETIKNQLEANDQRNKSIDERIASDKTLQIKR